MIAHRWHVVAKCFVCRMEIPVDLQRIVRERGPTTVLRDRDAACRGRGCKGRMMFMARRPGVDRYDALAGRPQKRVPAWKRGQGDG